MCILRSKLIDTIFPAGVLLNDFINLWVNRVYNSNSDRPLTVSVKGCHYNKLL